MVAAFYIHITIRPPPRTHRQKRCLKGLCHGWLVHFVLNNASNASLCAERPWNLRNQKITCGWKITAWWAIIPNVTSNKNELWKPFRRTSQLQSVLVFFKFVHSCLFLYLLCHLFIILISWAIFFLIGGSSHRLNFGKFRRLRAVSVFSCSVEQNARDTQMTTRVTEGARRALSFLASRGFADQRSRARVLPLLNLKKKTDYSQSINFVTQLL